MDLSHYIKKSETARKVSRSAPMEKRCLECGRNIDRHETELYLYYQRFCSENCKEKYMVGNEL